MKSFPRPCVIEANQVSTEGFCLGIRNGIALVEHPGGQVKCYDLFGAYSVTFLDR